MGTTKDRQKANTKDEDPTGLLNEGMRYRDLETGVWLSRDPAGFVDGPNLYAYVTQNPWSKFDPLGLQSFSRLWSVSERGGPAAAVQRVAEPYAQPVAEAVGGTLCEPLDWCLTAREIYNNPKSISSYAGLIPLVPSAVGKTSKFLSKADDLIPPASSIPSTSGAGGAVPSPSGSHATASSGAAVPDSPNVSVDSLVLGGSPAPQVSSVTSGSTTVDITLPQQAQTFEIIDGVRRAKAAQILGHESIAGKVWANGKIESVDVPIQSLLSPKGTINVGNAVDAQRFSSTLEKTRRAPVGPDNAIWIQPGTKGTPIPNVNLNYGK